ncbi:MAG: hypothetical protein QOJ74_1186, partial [Ilumatobacteraceae bacterium]|nr:hypothetical protein [Ilumatobacteraceae bacterium]
AYVPKEPMTCFAGVGSDAGTPG